ncbi:MAG: leucine-rich repeat domain-containing protein [Eubacteriales bacterium]
MKKFTLGILCLLLSAGLALSSCQKNDPDTEDEKQENTNSGLASIVLPEEEEEVVLYEYDYSGSEATLVAYNGDLEEVILDETVIRMKKQKQTTTVTEEVTAADGTVTTVEKQVEETVEVPVEYTLTAIDAGVFMNNESVKKIVIPDSVATVGDACFQGCTALEEVVLPAGLEEIGAQMFYGCDALTALNIPDTVTDIGLFAFGDFFVQIPWYKNLTDTSAIVGDGILLKYNGGAATVTYGDEVKKVAYYAFMDTPVQNVYFTDSVEEINDLAFYRSSATVMLPEGSALVNTLRLNNIKVATYAANGAVTEADAGEETEATDAAGETEAAE